MERHTKKNMKISIVC